MRKVGLFFSLAFFAVAFSPLAMPAGALVGDDAPVPTDELPVPVGAVDDAVGAVEELAPVAPVTKTVEDTVKQITATPAPDPGVDPLPEGDGGGATDSGPAPADRTPDGAGDGGRSTGGAERSTPAPASVASTPAAAADLPSPRALQRYIAKTPAPAPEPAPTLVAGAATERTAAGPAVEEIEKASKVTLGVLQVVALLMVVGMLSAEFLYGMRRISGGVLRA